MTEIERTKEADTLGEIPGRSGLQADRRTENKFIMQGVWPRSKEIHINKIRKDAMSYFGMQY